MYVSGHRTMGYCTAFFVVKIDTQSMTVIEDPAVDEEETQVCQVGTSGCQSFVCVCVCLGRESRGRGRAAAHTPATLCGLQLLL